MRKILKLSFSQILILILFSLSLISIKSATIHEINEDISGNSDYKKVSFESDGKTFNHFFKYSVKNIPKSRIGALRIDFDSFNELSQNNNVFCTFVKESTSDADLEQQLRLLTDEDTACVGKFNSKGIFDGIIEYNTTNTKLGIYLVAKGGIQFTATVYVRITEKYLDVKESTFTTDESYSLVPFTVYIPDFRDSASRILFYSYTRELQMYYVEQDTPYPEKLFSGNVMSVYTNPNMVHQKYHDANYMVLLTRDFTQDDKVSELFKFQVKFFPSNHLMDYYVSNNPYGRSKNTPLAINMTECGSPYYVILNYNTPEKKTSLYIDQIYGKIKSLSVAPTFSSITWEDMIEDDMIEIQVSSRKYELPKESETHMDVYKIECEIPLLLNFYYVDETADIPVLDYGQVVISTLKASQILSLPFAEGINLPELSIEIFNPIKLPLVIVDDGQNQNIVSKNTLIRSMPFTTSKPIIIKERGGDSNTRVIIKVGYYTGSWSSTEYENVVYSPQLNMFVFSFPNDAKKLNYTSANLITKGVNDGDNVKYCYGTNIGSAILPSNENCYRVSKDNSYTIKFLNPFVMYKDYNIDGDLTYYVSIKPISLKEEMEVVPELKTYDANERNIEGQGKILKIGTTGEVSSILTSPENKEVRIFVQVTQCDSSQITMSVLNAYNTSETIIETTTISSTNKKNFYQIFTNIFMETELHLTGNSGTNVFVKHTGIISVYSPKVKSSQNIEFNSDLNQLIVESPIENYERMKYIVLISAEGELSKKGITLCSFLDGDTLATYNKTVESYSEKTSIAINFNKAGLKAGDKFEALVYSEQQLNSKMSFLSEVFTGVVGEIKTETITEIKSVYDIDNDYVYARGTATTDGLVYYFSYLPETIKEVPIGAFNIELDSEPINGFSSIDCAFVDDGEDAMSMVEAVEDIIEARNPYCIGAQSTTNSKIFRYIFRYSYTSDNKPRRLVIKISNGKYVSDGFTVYLRKGNNTYIKKTGFEEQEEYGKQEEYKKSVIPYIVDLNKIRGSDDGDYVSKMLLYSQHLEMQMYYLDQTGQTNAPILLFTGNIMLVYTKLALAEQKYHATKLILLSENISGEEHSSLGNNYRFHTKMFRSDAQIEYFVSNNPVGRTLNFPLSVEMNTCTSTNNKYYYILNYNKAEDDRILYLDLLFGSMKRARIVNEINADKWDSLIQNNMVEITDYQINLVSRPQHIDIVEIECNSPLLANVYYNYEGQQFSGLGLGDIAIKTLGSQESTIITIDETMSGSLYYSISLFNNVENPDISFRFGNDRIHQVNENALQTGFLVKIPESISVMNNGNTPTRFIFKIGYGVESEWSDEKENIEGKLYSNENKFVYKFPVGDKKKNFTDVVLNVKPMKKGSDVKLNNIKFCYSTSLGMPIDASYENCFRTGANIPYSLKFINPLIAPKNYKTYSDNYYVTLSTYYTSEYISLDITENKYDASKRNIEGVGTIIKLENEREKSTILSLPEVIINPNILLQLQLCKSSNPSISYSIINAYTREVIGQNTLSKEDKFYTKPIVNSLMETEVKFIGSENDEIFAKHIGLNNYEIHLEEYEATFNDYQNVVNIVKPIFNEAFKIIVFVDKKGKFDDFSLCTFAEKTESQIKSLATYVNIFTSVGSNIITHYIDFSSINYKEGDEFDLLVYAIQVNNAKIEILYDVISGKVGKIQGVVKIESTIPNKNDYVTQLFIKNTTSNYLYYNFGRDPIGYVASLKIKPELDVEEGMRVNKVGCVFVDPSSTDEQMVKEVNNAMAQGTSVCVGEYQKDTNGYDALINANDLKSGSKNSRLVIQVIYGLGDEESEKEKLRDEFITLNITLRINGLKVENQDYGYNEDETLTLVPYVLDLLEIRQKGTGTDYVSKILLYSNTRELQMFYLASGAPTELFSGNIMLVYTNEDVVREKYFGATTMILLTDSFSASHTPSMGEKFKFKVNFFDSKATIQYYVSAKSNGRLLNNPTSIEMLSCDQPYYYILNYNAYESNRILHLDKIFGEINTTKIATKLNDDNWYEFIRNMESFEGNEYLIEEQDKYHIDVLEVTCQTPLLLNVYYTDPIATKKTNLDEGDISVISLAPGTSETLTFKTGLSGEFIYSFNVLRANNLPPNIVVRFDDEDMSINRNGVFNKRTKDNYPLINIYNNQITGTDETKIIFKFGYVISETFTKIANDMYNLQTENRPANLFAYIFKNGEDRLNYTKVIFEVKTTYENVKFCYTSNLGAFIDPSLQNCYRVGRNNPYNISVLNPYIMYKDYYTGEDVMDYYVSFRTENISLNVTIFPYLIEYDTKSRNLEGYPNSVIVPKEGNSTILTIPANKEKYLFVQMALCNSQSTIEYEFYNAYYGTSLGQTGNIQPSKENLYYYRNIENTNLDTKLSFEDLTKGKEVPEIFVKHKGINEKYQPIVQNIKITFEKDGEIIKFNQPIEGEEFNYTIYIDKKDNLVNQNYTLCSLFKKSKLAHYSQSFTSKEGNITIKLDFSKSELKGYEKYDCLILADNGKMMILSDIVSNKMDGRDDDDDSSNIVLISVLVGLAVLLVAGGIIMFICLRNLKNKPMENVIIAKPASLDDIQSANKGEKMLDSMAQSQAYENQH